MHSMFIMGAFLILLSFVLGRSHEDQFYNSDVIHPFLIVEDLMRDVGVLWDWHYSPALYVFPDWFLAAVVMLAPASNGWLPLLYGALIMTLYCLASAAILARIGGVSIVAAVWTMAAALFLAGCAFLPFTGASLSPWLYVTLAVPYFHTGALLATLVASALFLSLLYGRLQLWVAVGLAALVFAASFSDLLFVAWFVVPACLVALLHFWATGCSQGILLGGIIAGAALVGWMLEIALHADVRWKHLANVVTFQESLHALWGMVKLSAAEGDIPILLVMLLVTALLGRAAFLVGTSLRRRALRCDEAMELLFGCICAAAIIAPLAAGVFREVWGIRYMIVVLLIPLVWTVHYILRSPVISPKGFAWASVSIILVSSAAIAKPSWDAAQRLASPRPPQECLEAAGKTAGFGDYWTTKMLIFMSDRRLHVIQIKGGGEPYRWNINERWFTQRADDGTTPRPDFIFPQGLNPGQLRNRFGSPDRILICGGLDIWLYDNPLPLPG